MSLYNLNSTTKIEEKGGNFIEAGIKENLSFSRVVHSESPNGNKFLAFYFKDLSGAEVPKTEWEPKGNTEDEISEKVKKQMKRINHMLVDSGILKEEYLNIKADSFADFAKQLVVIIDTKGNKDVKFRAKVVYDDNNFTTLPAYTKYKFIEPMSVPVEKSKLRVLGIDKMERVRPDVTPGTSNPFEKIEITEATLVDDKTLDEVPF
jgi:hypothetical protein